MMAKLFRSWDWRPAKLRLACALVFSLVWVGSVAAQDRDPVEILRSFDETTAARSQSGGSAGPLMTTDEELKKTVLQERDVLRVYVVGELILSMDQAGIARGGAIHHPLLGELKVAGKTLGEAEKMIHEILLADYLVDPRVSLEIVEYAPYEFTVAGEVRNPATFTVPRNREIDVAQAILMAGGPTRLGASRATVERVVDGERTTIQVDLRAGRADPVKVRHRDIIRLGERWF
jgi:protein involved in polysaccharide export with SLBB domain